ncbi:SusE domain-containing protein [Flavobacterium sp.]|uniref:SusE domain-containing protein n=1 Tax=Flavobacterium sp. TaxID=239 RepID=UPI002FDE2F16
MKNLLKISTLTLLLFASVSCENDDQTIATPSGGPQLLTPLDGSSYVLLPQNATNEATTLVWNHADYSVQTEINYEVEVALSGTDFETIVSAGSTTNRFIVWTVEALNGVALQAGLIPYVAGDLDVRIKSSLGSNNDLPNYSNVITITVTPFTTDLPKLAVPGNHQGWSPGTAPRIAASGFGQTDYEGYVWLDGEFKFVAPNGSGVFEWGNTDWGDNGDFSGILAETGESNCSAVTGYYRVRANTTTLTYTTTAVSWGIIGSATPTGWDSDTDLIYNPTTKKLEIASIALVPGAFKFRGNNAWSNGFDLGTVNADGYLVDGGDLTFSGPAGNYKVILDLSNPRRYTYELIAL